MPKDNATKRPYTIKATSQKGRVILQGGDQNTIDSFSIGLDEPTASHIIKCVNMHDDLVEALNQINAMASRRFSASSAGLKETDDNLNHIIFKCKQALKKAEA